MDEKRAILLKFAEFIHDILKKNIAAMQTGVIDRTGIVSLRQGLEFALAAAQSRAISAIAPPVPGIVIDESGRRRPIYRSLLVYSWLRTMEIADIPWHGQLRSWCELLETRVLQATDDELAWNLLALQIAAAPLGRPDWKTLSDDFFDRLVREQQPNGALLHPSANMNPEIRWYDELVLLHALSTYAVQTQNLSTQAAVRRATDFHLAETQPDHATQQPWAVFAFISNPQTHLQAEQILHAIVMQNSESLDAVSLILLADALLCLRRELEGLSV